MEAPKMNFALKALMNLVNLSNWPNAKVANTALITEFIPEICKVPYDMLFRDDAVAMAECTLLVQEYLGLDLLTANMAQQSDHLKIWTTRTMAMGNVSDGKAYVEKEIAAGADYIKVILEDSPLT